jgi:NADPH:quinone reductase-like Zn-dependent oxidoreductase
MSYRHPVYSQLNSSFKADLIPCSDAAAEIVSLGTAVKGWSIGDRVCANFLLDHLDGDTNEKIQLSALGGPKDGVLSEYKIFPAHV